MVRRWLASKWLHMIISQKTTCVHHVSLKCCFNLYPAWALVFVPSSLSDPPHQNKNIKCPHASSSLSLLPIQGIHNDSTRVSHFPLNEGFTGLWRLLQSGHADGFLGPIICPVQVISHPVNRDSFDCVDSWERDTASENPIAAGQLNIYAYCMTEGCNDSSV